MLKKVIKFRDYDDNERETTAYFNLNESELAELIEEFGGRDSLTNLFANIKESGDGHRLTTFMRAIIKKAYGIKSGDGLRMKKTEEIWENFYQSEAYNEFFLGVMSSDAENANFLRNVVSKRLRPNVEEAIVKAKEELGDDGGKVITASFQTIG